MAIADFLNSLVGLEIFLAIFCTYLITKLPGKYWVKYTLIPLIFVIVMFTAAHFEDMMGRPLKAFPTGTFRLLGFKVVNPDGRKAIDLWTMESGLTRLYEIPYSDGNFKKLMEAQAAVQQGENVMGRRGNGDELDFGEGQGQGTSRDQLPPKD
jgi:hypothetical protein